MQSRFMKGENNPTILMLASSKRTEQSYLETFIEQKKRNESKTTLIVDEPQWIIRTDKDSPRKFKVAIGNKFLSSEVLPLNVSEEDLKIYRDRGFKILDVPMGYYENFLDDIDIALTDIAGISTTNSSRYISGPRIAAIKKDYLKNPFEKDIIEIENFTEENVNSPESIDLKTKFTEGSKKTLDSISGFFSKKKPTSKEDEAIETIKKLAELKDNGIITEEEFEAKKRQLLGI
jgi:hypothetical protein